MSEQWMIRGVEYTNCNCDIGCPCQFNAPSTHGLCEAIASIHIEEGSFDGISLDGVNFVLILKWPGEIAEGDGQQQLIIDEKASAEQRQAVEKIAFGESTAPGATHFFVFNSTMSKVHTTLYEPIEMSIDIDNREAHVKVGDVVESKGASIIDPFSSEKTRRGIHNPGGFEYTYAELGVGNSTINTAIQLDLNESYGQFNVLHMNQDGVIREAA
jgi:hypothetical protein